MPRPRTRVPAPLLVALPALLVAAVGLTHPLFLTPSTASRWQLGHLLLLPGFPLVAVSLWAVLRGERGPLAHASRLAAAAYALLYGALDTIAGIGAPAQVAAAARRHDPAPPIGDLFAVGDRLGHVGVVALGASALLAAAVLWQRAHDPRALGGGVVVAVACVPFWRHHVFPPQGVLALVAVAAGLALLEAGRRRA